MFNGLSIRGRLLATFVVSLTFLTLLAGVNLYSQHKSTAALAEIHDGSVQPLLAIQEIDSGLKEIRFRIAGVLLDQMPTQGSRNHLKDVRAQIPKAWDSFREQLPQELPADEKALVEKIDKGITALPAFFDQLDSAYHNDDKKSLSGLLEDDWPSIHSGVLKPLSQLIPVKVAAVKQVYEAGSQDGKKLNSLSIGSYVLCVLGLVFLILPLVHSLSKGINELKTVLGKVAEGDLNTHPDTNRQDEIGDMARSLDATIQGLREIIGSVQNAAHMLSDTSNKLSGEIGGVLDRGAARTEIMARASSSIDKMTADAHAVADGSGRVAEASSEARRIAGEGNLHMENSIGATARIESAVDGSASIIAELSAATDRINEFTQIIREIADQTNLLALNAAIEAARAGEQGRGFAVVADEVRKLAERTAASTAEIATTVGAIREKTSSAVAAMDQVRSEVMDGVRYNQETQQTLTGIVAAAERVTDLSSHIADATQHQMAASEDTAHDMEKVNQISAEDAAGIRRVDEVTRYVARMAEGLQQIVDRFRV